MEKNTEVIIYGCGKRGVKLIEILESSEYCVKYTIDSNKNRIGQFISGYKIESPEVLSHIANEKICIAIVDDKERNKVKENLKELYLLKDENIISYDALITEAYKTNRKIVEQIKKSECKSGLPRNILLDCSKGLVLGGVESWSKDICKAFWKNGIGKAYILSDIGNYDIEEELKDKVVNIEIDHQNEFSEQNISNCVNVILKYLPCSVIISNVDCIMLSAHIVQQFFPDHMKVISVIHNSNEYIYRNFYEFNGYSDLLLGVSEDIVQDMVKRGIPSNRITKMICPFECERNLQRTYTTDDNQPIRIGYAGRIEHHQKRMDLLLKVIEILESKNVNYILEIAGEGSYDNKVNEFIRDNKLENKVKKLGTIPRTGIPAFWKRQDICINMADFEGNSIMKMEAMANGAVPVVTKTSGVVEDITDGENGYIVELGDYNMAAKKIAYLSEHREQLPKMGVKAHQTVYPKSSMENHILLWRKIFNTI